MIEKCIYKIIAESHSEEGRAFKGSFEERHPDFSFKRCLFHCVGYNRHCVDYRTRMQYQVNETDCLR